MMKHPIVVILVLVGLVVIVGYANIKWAAYYIGNYADSVQHKSSHIIKNNNNSNTTTNTNHDEFINNNNNNKTIINKLQKTSIIYDSTEYANNPVYQEQIIIANRSSLSLPEQVLMQYIQQHSQQSLLQNPNNRTFIIGYYYCPQQAGNRMHDFVASLIFGIAMNRTLLWKYMDKPTCDQMAKVYNKSVTTAEYYYGDCQRTTINDCNQILQRALWIPSFDEWIPKLLLSSSYLSLNDTQLRPRVERLPQDIGPNATQQVIFNMPKFNGQVNFNRKSFVEIFGPDFVKNNPIVQKLYTQGVDYVQGMMFHYSFQLQHHLIPPEYDNHIIQNNNNNNNDNNNNPFVPHDEFSLFVHSRHTNKDQDGSNIALEATCLRRLIQYYTPKKYNSCKVYLLSDRNKTLSILSKILKRPPSSSSSSSSSHRVVPQQNRTLCVPIIASHEIKNGYTSEHGPFAGAGFYQDIIMASQARNGWIGSCKRSSTELVRELTEYKRQQQWQQQVNDINNILPPMLNCCWDMNRKSIRNFES